jgi:hypothetical protein
VKHLYGAFERTNYAANAFDVDLWDDTTQQDEVWVAKPKQDENWTPRTIQNEGWTVK